MNAELLLIDVGNTHVKWATATARGPLRPAGKVATASLSAAWIGALARKWPRHRLVLASVVPKWNAGFGRAFRGRVVIVSGRLGLLKPHFDYPKPAELGADRIATAVAVQAAGWFPAIIVACGTATAFTVLDAKGRLCGGAIAPGLQAQLAALIGATAQLPSTSLRAPRGALAKSTRDAIRTGIVLSFQGGVKETIRRLGESLPRGAKPHIILTGGDAKLAAKSLSMPRKVRPLLVLEGLRIIGNKVWNPESK